MKKGWHVALCFGVFLSLNKFSFGEELPEAKVNQAGDELNLIYTEISKRYKDYLNLESEVNRSLKNLEPLELKINSFSAQVENLRANILNTEKHLELIKEEVYAISLELADLKDLANKREIALTNARTALTEFIRLSYRELNKFTDLASGEISLLKFWLNSGSLAELKTRQTNLKVLQQTALQLIRELRASEAEYYKVKNDLLIKRGQLIVWQANFVKQKDHLAELKLGQELLLNKTRGEEEVYQNLIRQNKEEQAKALLEISELREKAVLLNAKLAEQKKGSAAKEFAALLKRQRSYGVSGLKFSQHIPRLVWPVKPIRGISAYFQDPEYEKIFGVKHNAIDIRIAQGSQVEAAAPGVVFRVRNNPESYSYVTIRHFKDQGGEEIITVYGHLMEIFIKEGELVQAGQKIGLSGGTPGTPGAGFMTTGPHLHFEVILKRRYQNPLDFLPLEQLPLTAIPQNYLEAADEGGTNN